MSATSTARSRVALVTGAGAGIGAATARALAAEHRVLVTDIDVAAAEAVAAGIREAGGDALAARLDTTDPEQHRAVLELVTREFGGLDVAVNNAGVTIPATPTADLSYAQWRHVLDVDLDGVFFGVQAQLPALLARGGGAIINVASIAAERALPGMAPYAAAKHAVLGLTRTIAWEYGDRGIRALAVGPGFIATGLEDNQPPEVRAALPGRHALDRLGRPEEVGEAIAWLASPAASFLTGALVPVDGGLLAG